ncbi:MAG: YeeE/YedE thiosulfate transporter family protein [Clostridiaceae bacterium]
MNLKDSRFYEKVLKNPWSYLAGAVLLSILQTVTFAVTGEPLGITRAFTNWGGWILGFLGASPDKWAYFNINEVRSSFSGGFLKDTFSVRTIGIIVGAFLASLLASEFRIRKIKSKKQIIGAILGGLLMGYGSRMANGCNIGAFYGGIASLSLSGWVFGIFLFVGSVVGGILLIKYLM